MRFQNFLFFWLGLNAVRLAVAPLFDLTPQEAYYHLYAENLALSYFDHPPVLAWGLRAFTEIFGKHPTTLRFFAFSASLVTQALWLSLAFKFKPTEWKTLAPWWLVTGVVTVTSLISTPDVPLLLFWTLSIHQLWKALFEHRQWAFVTAGVAMGIAFDSKYTGIFLQGGFFLFLLLSKTHRPLLRTVWPWLSLAVAQGVMAPVYIWNAQHGFASFLFQTTERASHSSGLGLRWFLSVVATQSVLLGPVLFLALGVLMFRLLKTPRDTPEFFLACFFVPLFAVFLGISFFALVKPNWMMPSYVTGSLLAASWLSTKWLRAHLGFQFVLHALAFFELVFYPIPIPSDDTWVGWPELARHAETLAETQPSAFFVSADGYKTSAQLRFYTSLEVYGPNAVGQRGLQFDYLNEPLETLKGRNAFFIDSTPKNTSPEKGHDVPEVLQRHFESVEEYEPLLISKNGRPVRRFRVFFARGYRPESKP